MIFVNCVSRDKKTAKNNEFVLLSNSWAHSWEVISKDKTLREHEQQTESTLLMSVLISFVWH